VRSGEQASRRKRRDGQRSYGQSKVETADENMTNQQADNDGIRVRSCPIWELRAPTAPFLMAPLEVGTQWSASVYSVFRYDSWYFAALRPRGQ